MAFAIFTSAWQAEAVLSLVDSNNDVATGGEWDRPHCLSVMHSVSPAPNDIV